MHSIFNGEALLTVNTNKPTKNMYEFEGNISLRNTKTGVESLK